MSAVVTDPHALIWYLFEPKRLSSVARTALLQAEANPGIIYVPAISVVEARYLVEKGTILESVFQRLVDSLLDPATPLTVVPLSLDIACSLKEVSKRAVPDMPDRIIAATALQLHLPLITRDRKIRASQIECIW
jgi:PIN domain nuclease of toxin-antitoxin system